MTYTRRKGSIDEFKMWAHRYARSLFNISSWMEYLKSVSFVVGPRIHGIMLGLQAGTPGLCIAHDSRTREMCETMGVPFVMAKAVAQGIKFEELRSHFVFDGAAFDARRKTLGTRLSEFLEVNGVPQSAWLQDIVHK